MSGSSTTPRPEDELLDQWARTGLPGRLSLAAYLTEQHAPVYRLIVEVLLQAQTTSLTGVGRDDLRAEITGRLRALNADPLLIESLDLAPRMAQLREWGVVDIWQDRAVRDDDFLRNRDRYQLTAPAAALHRAIATLGEDETRAVAAVLAPAVLAEQLGLFAEGLRADPEQATRAWSVLASTTDAMARSAAAWQSRLASALGGTPSPAKVAQARDIISRYVEMWGSGIDTHSPRIAARLSAIEALDDEAWRRAAMTLTGAGAVEERVAEQVDQLRATIALIARWFTGERPQAPTLRSQMASAVAPLIRSQRTVAAVGGHVSRRRELLALAGRIAAADSDADAWHEWCLGTGLFSAAHHAPRSPDTVGSATPSFWEAQPAAVEARLRRQGPRALVGRPAHMPDRTTAKRHARATAAAEAKKRAQLQHDLLALSGHALDELAPLAPEVGRALIALLADVAGAAARTWRRDGERPLDLTSSDDEWLVGLEPRPGSAVVDVGDGRFVHRNLRLTLRLAGRPDLVVVRTQPDDAGRTEPVAGFEATG